jgi:peptidoglycan/LPS O-acetylase OafA/YrhL
MSFLLVFVAHAGLHDVVPGGFGVTVFFFLSGFLITTLLRLEHDSRGTISFSQFYLRRVLRILPPFYVVLVAAAVAAAAGIVSGGVHPQALAAQALYYANYWIVGHGYVGMPSGTGVYWSLAVEEHFYLLFPALYFLLRRFLPTTRQALVVWGLCGVVLAWRVILVYALHADSNRTYLASDTRVDSILFGCALALYGNPAMDGPSRFSAKVWKWQLLPASLLVLLFTFAYRDPSFRQSFRYTLQGIALGPLFVAAMRYPDWGPFRLLNLRAVSFVGVLSYSLYLVHHVILGVLGTEPSLSRAVLALAASLAAAYAIYVLVEKPCARLRRRLSHVIAREPAGSPAPVRASAALVEERS